MRYSPTLALIFFFFFLSFSIFYFPASGQAVVTGVVPSLPPWFLPLQFLSRIGFSNPTCSSIFLHRVSLTHALSGFPQVNLCPKTIPTIVNEYALGGTRTH